MARDPKYIINYNIYYKLSQLHETNKEGFQAKFGNVFYFFLYFVFVCIAFENVP